MERLARRVDDRERDAARWELVAHGLAQVGEHRDDAHRPARQRALDPALAGPAAALHLRQHDRQLVASGDPLDAAHDLQRPLALELVEDELEELRPTSGANRPLVVVPADDRLDPRRVPGATSDRPLRTFDTVGVETPASRAITARVVPLRPARRSGVVMRGV